MQRKYLFQRIFWQSVAAAVTHPMPCGPRVERRLLPNPLDHRALPPVNFSRRSASRAPVTPLEEFDSKILLCCLNDHRLNQIQVVLD